MAAHVPTVSEPSLTIGYSVLADRIAGLQLPAPRADVELLVVVQGDADQPVALRGDVRLVRLSSLGVAKSRNEVLRRARGQFVLFADDDVVLHEDGVRRLLELFARDPSLALALGQAVGPDGRLRKRYPRRGVPLRRWNAAKAATYEMM